MAAQLESHGNDPERDTALAGMANGAARQVAATSTLVEYDLQATAGSEQVRALASRLSRLGAAARAAIDESAFATAIL